MHKRGNSGNHANRELPIVRCNRCGKKYQLRHSCSAEVSFTVEAERAPGVLDLMNKPIGFRLIKGFGILSGYSRVP